MLDILTCVQRVHYTEQLLIPILFITLIILPFYNIINNIAYLNIYTAYDIIHQILFGLFSTIKHINK